MHTLESNLLDALAEVDAILDTYMASDFNKSDDAHSMPPNHEFLEADTFSHLNEQASDEEYAQSSQESSALGSSSFLGFQNFHNPVNIVEVSPWQYHNIDNKVRARYVIAKTAEGFHWDSDYIISASKEEALHALEKNRSTPCNATTISKLPLWSSAYSSLSECVDKAKRDIQLQIEAIDLDISIPVHFYPGTENAELRDLAEIKICPSLASRLHATDLRRVAIFHGYLNWNEYLASQTFEHEM